MAKQNPRIIRNSARCNHCHDHLESRHVHDFVTCKCGKLSVDGGRDYLKRLGEPDNREETSILDGTTAHWF